MEEFAANEVKKFHDSLRKKVSLILILQALKPKNFTISSLTVYLEVAVRPNSGDETADKIAEIYQKLNAPPEGRFIGPYNPVN